MKVTESMRIRASVQFAKGQGAELSRENDTINIDIWQTDNGDWRRDRDSYINGRSRSTVPDHATQAGAVGVAVRDVAQAIRNGFTFEQPE